MSKLGESRPNGEDELVLVFRPPESPAAQMAADTPFKGHRISVDELLDWFKDSRSIPSNSGLRVHGRPETVLNSSYL